MGGSQESKMQSVYVLREDCHQFSDKLESLKSKVIAVYESPEGAWKELKKAVRGSKGYISCSLYKKTFESWIKDVEIQGLSLKLMKWDENKFHPENEENSWYVTKYSVIKHEEEEEEEEKKKKGREKNQKEENEKSNKEEEKQEEDEISKMSQICGFITKTLLSFNSSEEEEDVLKHEKEEEEEEKKKRGQEKNQKEENEKSNKEEEKQIGKKEETHEEKTQKDREETPQ